MRSNDNLDGKSIESTIGGAICVCGWVGGLCSLNGSESRMMTTLVFRQLDRTRQVGLARPGASSRDSWPDKFIGAVTVIGALTL